MNIILIAIVSYVLDGVSTKVVTNGMSSHIHFAAAGTKYVFSKFLGPFQVISTSTTFLLEPSCTQGSFMILMIIA